MRKLSVIAIFAAGLMLASCQQKKDKAPADNTQEATLTEQNDSTAEEDSIAENVLTDFTMNDVKGNPVSVMDEVAKHKITIIDFWASWCGPCRAEMPNLVRLYAEQKDDGLGIIGVSLDNDQSNWENAIEKDGITWLQLSDLQGWENAAARMYNVNSIPHTIVVDANGTILAEGLRGEQLDAFIKENL